MKLRPAALLLLVACLGASPAQAQSTQRGTVIIDLEPGGRARGFALLWRLGDRTLVEGLATDTAGNVYFTAGGVLYSVRAETGDVNWTHACPGGCLGVALGPDSVFTTFGSGVNLRKLDRDGAWQCDHDTGMSLGLTSSPEIVVAGDRIVVQSAGTGPTGELGRLHVLDLDCNLRQDVPAPLWRRGNGNPVVDLATRRLVTYWGDPDATTNRSLVFTEVRDLDTGALLCTTPQGAWRQALPATALWHGVGTVAISGIDPAPPDAWCDASEDWSIGTVDGVPTGDPRDMAFDAGAFYLLSNPYGSTWPSGGHPGRLLKVDLATRSVLWMSTDFGTSADPITNVNKMGIAGRWAAVTHGRNGAANAATWMATIVDLDDGATVATFGRRRVHRLTHERLVDGGIFFHTSQYGIASAPDTPLLAWQLGSGAFRGHSYRFGDERGNKYCPDCLSTLEGVLADCTAPAPDGSFECTLTNLYPRDVTRVLFTTLPAGQAYEVHACSGELLGSGTGEAAATVALPAGGTLLAELLPAGGAYDPGRITEPLTVRKSTRTPGELALRWTPSCSVHAIDHAIYEGAIGSWLSHVPVACSDAGGDGVEELHPAPGGTYYLVVPQGTRFEGSYGTDSFGRERPAGASPCLPCRITSGCR